MIKMTLHKLLNISCIAASLLCTPYVSAAVSAEQAFTEQESENKALLTGKWQCQSNVPEYQIETSTEDEYRNDGAYVSKSRTAIKLGQAVQKSEIEVQAKWTLSGNTLRLNQVELKAVRSDDPQYAAQLNKVFQQLNWAENRVLSLSSASMAFLPIAPMASEQPIHCQKQR